MLDIHNIVADGTTISSFIITYLGKSGIKIGDVRPFLGGCYIILPDNKMSIRIIGNLISVDMETTDVSTFKPLFSLNVYDPPTIGYMMAAIKAQSKAIY